MTKPEDVVATAARSEALMMLLSGSNPTNTILPQVKIGLEVFPHSVGIIIPSRDSSGNLLPRWMNKYAVKMVEAYLFMLQKGCTSINGKNHTKGMYLSKIENTIRENGILVFSSVKEINIATLSELIQIASILQRVLNQESIALLIDGKMLLVGAASVSFINNIGSLRACGEVY